MSKTKLELAKEALKATYLKFFPNEKFAEMKTKDGNMIYVDGEAPAVGVPVMIMDAEGAKAAAPDGDLIMEDGTTISVKDGMITAVTPGEGEAAATEESKLSKLEAQIAKLEIAKEIARHKDEIEQLKAKQATLCSQEDYKKLESEFEKQKTELEFHKTFTKQVMAFMEILGEEPDTEAKAAPAKDGFKKVAKTVDIKKEISAFRASLQENAR